MTIVDRIIGIAATVLSGGSFAGSIKSAFINEAIDILRENKVKSIQEKEKHLSGAETILSRINTGEKVNGKKRYF